MRQSRLLAGMMLWLCSAAVVLAHPLGEPPGRQIDIGGRRMHLWCVGRGEPTVVIDAGLGASAAEWQPVMERVGGHARICAYDRAGYGWSDPGPAPRTSSQHANDLYLLLLNAGESGPFVLVGHSYGGYNAQLFARRYPFLVAGLVLVDASHPEQIERFLAPPYGIRVAPSNRLGVVRFGETPRPHPALPARARELAAYQYRHWRPRRAISSEMLGFADSARELRAERPLPPVPLVVLTRGRRVWPAGAHGDALESLWLSLQAELAAQSPVAAHLLARDSGHQIHLDQPELVAFAVALASSAGPPDEQRAPGFTNWPPSPDLRGFTWLRDTLEVRLPRQVVAFGRAGAPAR
jgi:pimeloyl-ACP methyl ester carboxylesterase